jgi:hypothetical protein
MKVGDLVRHRFDGVWVYEVGLVTDIRRSPNRGLGMASVMWWDSSLIRDYLIRDLETVNESPC